MEGPAVCVPLISSTGHGDAALHRVHYQEGKFALANLLVALIPKDKTICDPQYLYHLLMAKKEDYFVPLMLGTANVSLKEQDIAGVEISLPPLSEQRRVVSRIVELAPRIEKARGLQREAKAEANALLPATLGNFFKEVSKTHAVSTLGSLCSQITDGPHKTPTYVQAGIPFVTVKNMVTGKLSFDDLEYITEEDHAEFSKRCKPEFGDVLYSKDGATRGRACFVDTNRDFSIFVSVALIKPLRDRLDGRYLCYLLSSTWIRDLMNAKSRGDMIPHIVLKQIKSFPVPTPPVPEQRRIVVRLDKLQANIDALRNLQSDTAAELDALMPSILSKAFRGEL
jgi:type I restriction enzyme S subunit